MANGVVKLIVNTPTRTGWKTDEGRIRSTAVKLNIPMITTATAAVAAANAIDAMHSDWSVAALQDLRSLGRESPSAGRGEDAEGDADEGVTRSHLSKSLRCKRQRNHQLETHSLSTKPVALKPTCSSGDDRAGRSARAWGISPGICSSVRVAWVFGVAPNVKLLARLGLYLFHCFYGF